LSLILGICFCEATLHLPKEEDKGAFASRTPPPVWGASVCRGCPGLHPPGPAAGPPTPGPGQDDEGGRGGGPCHGPPPLANRVDKERSSSRPDNLAGEKGEANFSREVQALPPFPAGRAECADRWLEHIPHPLTPNSIYPKKTPVLREGWVSVFGRGGSIEENKTRAFEGHATLCAFVRGF